MLKNTRDFILKYRFPATKIKLLILGLSLYWLGIKVWQFGKTHLLRWIRVPTWAASAIQSPCLASIGILICDHVVFLASLAQYSGQGHVGYFCGLQSALVFVSASARVQRHFLSDAGILRNCGQQEIALA